MMFIEFKINEESKYECVGRFYYYLLIIIIEGILIESINQVDKN